MKDAFVSARSTLVGVVIVLLVVIWALRDLALLVGYAVLLAYALLPVVKVIERVRDSRGRHVPRGIVAAAVMLALVSIAGWLVVLAVPRIVSEAAHFAAGAPDLLARVVQGLHAYADARGLNAWLDPAIDSVHASATDALQNLGGLLARGAPRVFGGLGHLLGLALLPVLAFYLLADSEAVQLSALRFVPEDARGEVTRLGGAVDRALRSYVRGQAVVCVVTGTLVGIALALLHHPAASLLGALAGAAELIPYLGFLVTAIAIGLAGASVSPLQAVLGLAAYIALNWTIGTLVTPRLMGRYLKMHPFIVTVSVLAGAQLLGPAGALLALPGAAVIQAIIGELAPAAAPAPHAAHAAHAAAPRAVNPPGTEH